MTVGWGWGRTGCRRGSNRIVGNRVENPARARCCDGGALYTLGPQPNSVMERNHVVSHGPDVSALTTPTGPQIPIAVGERGAGAGKRSLDRKKKNTVSVFRV